MFMILVVLFCIGACPRPGHAGEYYTSDKGNLFYVEKDLNLNFFDSLIACNNMNMSLIAPNTEAKQMEFNKTVAAYKGLVYLWIAGIEIDNLNFMWVTVGQKLSYTNWYVNEPNRDGDKKQCIGTNDAEWRSYDCNSRRNYICEKYPIRERIDSVKEEQSFRISLDMEKTKFNECKEQLGSCDKETKQKTQENDKLKIENQYFQNQLIQANLTLELLKITHQKDIQVFEEKHKNVLNERKLLTTMHQKDILHLEEKHNNTLNSLKMACDLVANRTDPIKNYNVLIYTTGNRN